MRLLAYRRITAAAAAAAAHNDKDGRGWRRAVAGCDGIGVRSADGIRLISLSLCEGRVNRYSEGRASYNPTPAYGYRALRSNLSGSFAKVYLCTGVCVFVRSEANNGNAL